MRSVLLVLVVLVAACQKPAKLAEVRVDDAEAKALLGEAKEGVQVGAAKVTAVRGTHFGSVEVEVELEGKPLRLEVRPKDDKSPPCMAEARSLCVYVMAHNDSATNEAMRTLTTQLAANIEAAIQKGAKVPAGLTSLAVERVRRAARDAGP